jgi:hypothetical protein
MSKLIYKGLKIFSVILALLSVIYYGGAFLLPSQQYINEKTEVTADPVAVYSKLKNVASLNAALNKAFGKNLLLSVKDTSLFKEIHYEVLDIRKEKPIYSGYYLQENNDGTGLLWYLKLDSLDYPNGRWEGFLTTFLYREKIRQGFVQVEETVSK